MNAGQDSQDERTRLEETLRGEDPTLAVMGLPQLEGYVTLGVLAHEEEVEAARSRILSLEGKGYAVSQSDELLYWPFPSSNPHPERLTELEDTYKVYGSETDFIVGILRVTDWDDFMDEMDYS